MMNHDFAPHTLVGVPALSRRRKCAVRLPNRGQEQVTIDVQVRMNTMNLAPQQLPGGELAPLSTDEPGWEQWMRCSPAPRTARHPADPRQADIASTPKCSRMLACTCAGGPVASTAATTSLARNRSSTGLVLAW
jgi:hypothetical protein